MNTIKSLLILCFCITLICFGSCFSPRAMKSQHFGDGPSTGKSDRDGDSIPDSIDKCPDVPGPASLQGCPDSDGDGIADADDLCPAVGGIKRYKGCPVPDNDADGINDDEDKCPTVAGPPDNFGCPVIKEEVLKAVNSNSDRDKDGVPDKYDDCPDVYGRINNRGCPNQRITDPTLVNYDLVERITKQKIDSVQNITNADTFKKTASLGFSYFNKMKQNETKDFRVFVQIDGKGNIIYQEIRNKEKIEGPDEYNTDTSKIIILPYKIDVYEKLKILLEGDSADFKIIPQTQEEQKLDLVNGNHWHWHLRAVASSERVAQITMKILAFKLGGDTVLLPQKQVKIKIAINKPDQLPVSFWTKVLDWIGNNIQYVLGSLVIPFIIWLYGQRKKRKQDNPVAKTNNNTE